jgi:preprotein translocase subunit SecD
MGPLEIRGPGLFNPIPFDRKAPVTPRKILAVLVVALACYCIYSVIPPKEKLRMGLDIRGGVHLRLDVDRDKMPAETSKKEVMDAADRALEIIRTRVSGDTGTGEAMVQREGETGIVVQIPGFTDVKRAQDIISTTAQLQFRLVSSERVADFKKPDGTIDEKKLPKNQFYFKGKEDGEEFLLSETKMKGDALSDARVQTDTLGKAIISFKFNSQGGKDFGKLTSANVGRRLAILLDDKVYSAPVIKSPIMGGSGIIEGSFTDEEARDLALILRAGALPAPLKITSQFVVGPTLGADSVKKGTLAAVYGFLLVLLYMVIYYRVSGFIADIGMIFNVIFLMGFMAVMKATMTLPGIAGIVLTVGMSVDSNVLIFERIREEMKAGKTIRAAIEAGYDRALSAIIDTHVTTLITSVVLFQFGTGPVKGFAVTLSVGIALSLFTAVVITKMIFDTRKEYHTLSI